MEGIKFPYLAVVFQGQCRNDKVKRVEATVQEAVYKDPAWIITQIITSLSFTHSRIVGRKAVIYIE